MKVYVNAGETINVGSSVQGIGAGTINLRSPSGTTFSSGTSTTVGLIANRGQEVAGPLPAAGGYTPYIHVVDVTEAGVWEIDFISQNGGQGSENPVPIAANDNWVQPTGQYIAAFDVSVMNAAKTAFLTGRVYTNIYSGILGDFLSGFNGIFQILTKDGYLYSLDNNGQAGNGFSFFANNKGFRANGVASYKSVNSIVAPNIQDPRSPDTQTDITYKIFFNSPAADLPLTANTPGGSTWLLNPVVDPMLTNFKFTGTEGTPNKAGTAPLGATFAFTANKNGTYIVSIDVDKNGVFNDPIDRQITGQIIAGTNQATWDGLDGLGNKVPVGSFTSNLNVVLFGGEVHFPFFDVERNVNGIKLTRVNGNLAPDFTVYWDDSDISLTGTPSNPIKNITTGINSQINGHIWGTAGKSATDFGDNRGMDTYAYIAATPLVASVNFQLQEADLEIKPITNISTGISCAGQQIAYTITVQNNGPSDVAGSKLNIALSANLASIAITDVATSGTSVVNGGALSGQNYTATIDLANGAVHTFTVNAKATTTAGGSASITAAILRTADMTDPDATNPDSNPPSDATLECNSAPSGGGCNNIQTVNITFIALPSAGADQSIYQNGNVTLTDANPGTWSQLGTTPAVTNIASPVALGTQVAGFTNIGNYYYLRTNSLGCTDTVMVTVVPNVLDIPTVFTPNGDGKNDTFAIPNLSAFPGTQLFVYNRWGNEVYRSLDYQNSWTGNGLSEGTYYYLINKKELTGSFTPYKGWLFLKR